MAVVRDYFFTHFAVYGLTLAKQQIQHLLSFHEQAINALALKMLRLEHVSQLPRMFQIAAGNLNLLRRSGQEFSELFGEALRQANLPMQRLAQSAHQLGLPFQDWIQTGGPLDRAQNSFLTFQQRIQRAQQALQRGNINTFVQQSSLAVQSLENSLRQLDRAIRLVQRTAPGLAGQTFLQSLHRVRSQWQQLLTDFYQMGFIRGLRPFHPFATLRQYFHQFPWGDLFQSLVRGQFRNALQLFSQRFQAMGQIARTQLVGAFSVFLTQLSKAGILIGTMLVPAFFAIARIFYTVADNLHTTYRMVVHFGMKLSTAFSYARIGREFGLNMEAFAAAAAHLSDAITKHPWGMRYMIAWLGLSPFQLAGKQPIEAVEEVLQRLMKLPDVSKRMTIGRLLLGEQFSELYFAHQSGVLQLMKEYRRFDAQTILHVQKLWVEWTKIKLVIQDIGIDLAKGVLPLISRVRSFFEFLFRIRSFLYFLTVLFGVLLTVKGIALRNPLAILGGLGVAGLGATALLGYFDRTDNTLNAQLAELETQTTLLDLQYRAIQNLRMELHQFLATTARGVPSLYQASIYRALLSNTGGI